MQAVQWEGSRKTDRSWGWEGTLGPLSVSSPFTHLCLSVRLPGRGSGLKLCNAVQYESWVLWGNPTSLSWGGG